VDALIFRGDRSPQSNRDLRRYILTKSKEALGVIGLLKLKETPRDDYLGK
jgi:hypothetical protein